MKLPAMISAIAALIRAFPTEPFVISPQLAVLGVALLAWAIWLA